MIQTMAAPTEKELASRALELLGKCEAGDAITIETICGQTIVKIQISKAHPPAAN